MSICVCIGIRGVDQFELREEGGEIGAAGRVLRFVVLVGDIVFDCVTSIVASQGMTYCRDVPS
jgi:hypothetical protein